MSRLLRARATCSRKDRRSRVAAKRAEQGSAMKILIAGASGAIGRPLVRRLRANQHEVFALTRSPDSAPPLKEIGAKPVIASRVLQGHLRHLASAKKRRFGCQAPTRSTTRRDLGALRMRKPGASLNS